METNKINFFALGAAGDTTVSVVIETVFPALINIFSEDEACSSCRKAYISQNYISLIIIISS